MNAMIISFRNLLLLLGTLMTLAVAAPALALNESQLDQDIDAALKALYSSSPVAKALSEKATGILVFPNIVKAGFIVGGLGGDGALIKNGKKVAYYNTAAASVGMQAGVQTYGFAIFFLDNKVLKDFEKSKGWELGVGPSLVVVDTGFGKDVNTLTGKNEVYAFIFDQKGLMAGVGLQGTKITKLSH